MLRVTWCRGGRRGRSRRRKGGKTENLEVRILDWRTRLDDQREGEVEYLVSWRVRRSRSRRPGGGSEGPRQE